MYVYDDGIVKAMINARLTDKYIELSDFYVDPYFQHEGIGTSIMSEFEKTAKNSKKNIRFWVLDKNEPAREFYEKIGYKLTGTKEEFEDSGFYILQYQKTFS